MRVEPVLSHPHVRAPRACTAILLALTSAGCASDYEVIAEPVDVNPGEVTDCGFTRVQDTDFYEYDCNPVFTTTGEEWARAIGSTTFTVAPVMGHAMYQLWYSGVPEGVEDYGTYGLGYAISDNGTSWQTHRDNPLLNETGMRAWDGSNMDALQVVWDPGAQKYVLIYQGYNLEENTWGLGVAESPDGRVWSRLPDNPVMNFASSLGGKRWCWPLGLTLSPYNDGGYRGYIAGAENNSDRCEVYGVTASTTSDWSPDDEPTLAAAPEGSWDDTGVISLAIAELKGTWYMFYVGFGTWETHAGESYVTSKDQYLGWARSNNGQDWIREQDPIPLHKETASGTGEVGAVAAVAVGNRIHLWVTDTYTIDGAEQGGVGLFLFDPLRQTTDTGGE